MPDVDRERQKDAALGADASGHRAEQKRTRHTDELDQHEGRDLRVLVDADFDAVDRRHPDDGLDPVVVERGTRRASETPGDSRAARGRSSAVAPVAIRIEFWRRRSSASSVGAGSGTRKNNGSEKTSHHTATLTNDSLMAATESASPNVAGLRIHARFRTSSTPPPRYPIAYAAVETRSISSGGCDVWQQRVVEHEARPRCRCWRS